MTSTKPRRRMLRNLTLIFVVVCLLLLTILGVVQHRAQRKLNVWMASEEYQITRDKLFNRKAPLDKNPLEDLDIAPKTSSKRRGVQANGESPATDLMERLFGEQNSISIKALRDDAALLEEIAAYLETHAELFQLLLDVNNRSSLDSITWEKDDQGTLRPNLKGYTKIRSLMRMIALRSYHDAATGKPAEAWQWLNLGMDTSNQLADSSPILGLMVMKANHHILRNAAEDMLQQELPPGATLEEMDRALQATAEIAIMHNTLETELVYSTEMHLQQLDQAQGFSALIGRLFANNIMGPLFDAEQELITILQQDDVTQRLQSYQALTAEMESSSTLIQMIMPGIIRATEGFEQHIIETDLLRLGLAASQYHADFGGYPTTIGGIESLLNAPLANSGIYAATVEEGRLTLTTILSEIIPGVEVAGLVLD